MTFNVSNIYLIPFKNVKGIGDKTLFEIYNKFGNFQKAYNASLDEFEDIIRDKKTLINISEFLNNKDKTIQEVKNINKILNEKNIKFVCYFDKEYPKSLANIENPPIGLFIKGNIFLNEVEDSISIIGTRNPTYYGHTKARNIAREMAENGYIVISGLARGIDIEAHLGALEGRGITIAVLGSGVENIYPNEHKNVAKEIIKDGALISELYIDQRISQFSLINRNRITSGLSKASLIIEGNLNSGTRYGARFAKAQNKYIFALKPKNPKNQSSKLPIELIKNNAVEIETASDILDYLNSVVFKDKFPQPKPVLITDYLYTEKKSERKEPKKIYYPIPRLINPFDERIIILIKIIKNLMINYYKGGISGNFDRSLNKKIFLLTKILNRFDNSYLSEFIRLPSMKPNYQGLSTLFFNCNIDTLKKKLSNQEIQKEDIRRSIFVLSGDLALEFQNYFESHITLEKFYIKDVHASFLHKIQSRNEFFTETLHFDNFKEALRILQEYGIIKLIGEVYNRDSSNTEWVIIDKLRLKEYINWSSINFLLYIISEGIIR